MRLSFQKGEDVGESIFLDKGDSPKTKETFFSQSYFDNENFDF